MTEAPLPSTRSPNAGPLPSLALFGDAVKQRPVGSLLGLVLEYGMFFSAVLLALGLFATRVPLRVLDRALGLRLRERFVNLLARVSPG